jgi:lipopolysaccharide export system protein LptA
MLTFLPVLRRRTVGGLLLCLLCLLAAVPAAGQVPGKTRIEIVKAGVMSSDKDIAGGARRLIGDVIFRHQQAMLYCDSAWMHPATGNVDAFGHVRIVQGDTLTLTGRRLFYSDSLQRAQIYEDVVLKDRNMTLTTDRLDYYMETGIASYTTGAKIIDGENTLTSRAGSYYSLSHDLYFRHDVVLVNPRYELKGDTLRYNTNNSTAYFLGPTRILSDSNSIYCEGGWYQTLSQVSEFFSHAVLRSSGQELTGDTIHYNRLTAAGRATGHVAIRDSANKVTITGDYGEYYQATDSSFTTGHTLMMQDVDGDTLFLHADTLMAVGARGDSSAANASRHTLFAYHGVRIYKSDLQGRCDSLVYDYRDSSIYLYTRPVLWSGYNQLTADSVRLQMANSRMDRIFLVNSAFLVSRADTLEQGAVDSLRFNQIRGKNMTGFFEENKLKRIDVEGNGQTIYYAKNKKDRMVGVNRADCSDLVIRIAGNQVQRVTLLNKPDATLYPIGELLVGELRLKGFNWQPELRPESKSSLLLPD